MGIAMAKPPPDLALKSLADVHAAFFQFLRRRLGSHDRATEVMQDVYLRVLKHGDELREQESAKAWLKRILRSALVDHIRRAKTRQQFEVEFARRETQFESSLEDELEALVCLCLYKLLPLLRPEYAEVLRRADLENENRESIAKDLGLSPGTLAVRLHRARRALRRALQLTCETCPIHGYFDCGCDYSERLRAARLRQATVSDHAQV